MARILLADDGVAFDGRSLEGKAAGGAETAFKQLAEGLAQLGHDVLAIAHGAEALQHKNVTWQPLAAGLPAQADLFIANRSPHLLRHVRQARRSLFWVHNDARYLLKPRYLIDLWRRRPEFVFVSHAQDAAAPGWLPASARHVIALGLDEAFRGEAPRDPPPPMALYAANPLRGLAQLAPLWVKAIAPLVPGARLDVHAGLTMYGAAAKPRTQMAMQLAIDAAHQAAGPTLTLAGLLDRAGLIAKLRAARVYLYPGDPTETFCLAVAEAQAMGVPCVVMARGALVERVADGITGFVVHNEADFAQAARRLLQDDEVWRRQHQACLARQRHRGWSEMAADFAQRCP